MGRDLNADLRVKGRGYENQNKGVRLKSVHIL
jgi:hypothetical protein